MPESVDSFKSYQLACVSIQKMRFLTFLKMGKVYKKNN
jgi:hypothetical protein